MKSKRWSMLHEMDCTDGLPVVIPTSERVKMVCAGHRFGWRHGAW